MPRTILYLEKQVQLKVLVSNILVGNADFDLCGQSSRITLIRLRTIHTLRLVCKAWKYVVEKNIEYNASRLAEYNYTIYPYQKTIRFMFIENNIVDLFQENMKSFTKSRHVSTRFPRKILRARLEDLTLDQLDRLTEELESCFSVVEIYGMVFHPTAPYWMCPANRGVVRNVFHCPPTNWRSQFTLLSLQIFWP